MSETHSMPRPLSQAEQSALIEELQQSRGAPAHTSELVADSVPSARLYVEPGRAVCRYPGCEWAVVSGRYAASTGHKDRRYVAEARSLSEAAISHAMAHGPMSAVDDLSCENVRRLLSAPILGERPHRRTDRCSAVFSVVAPTGGTEMVLGDTLRAAFNAHWELCSLQRTIERMKAVGAPLLHPAAPEGCDTLMPVLWHWDWRSAGHRTQWETR